jgi:EAL domain
VEGKRYGTFFRELLDFHGFPPHRIVVEILESELNDEQELDDAIRFYRELGCLIAIDDFGAGHSNFDRVWRLRPDIVKFDRSIVVRAAGDRGVRSVVVGMASLVHEAGSLVLMEGIENELEAMIAMDADADFVQGYYFAKPNASIQTISSSSLPLTNLFDNFSRIVTAEGNNYRAEVSPYLNGLGYASVLLRAGQPLAVACRGFLEHPLAERCFLLDQFGTQIGSNVNAPHPVVGQSPRYMPLRDSSGANWSRRHYFRRAMAQTEKVHVTRPYLSAPTSTQCVTASIAIKIDSELRVLCGDIVWNDKLYGGSRSSDSGN